MVAAGLAAGAGLAASLGARAIECRAARWFLPDRRADPPGSDARAGRTQAPGWIGRDRTLGWTGQGLTPSRDPAPRSQAPPMKPTAATGPLFATPCDQPVLGVRAHPIDQRLTVPRGQAVLVLGHADAGPRAGRINRRRIARGLAALEADGVLIVSGGAVAGRRSEARLLADAARDAGYRGPIALEEASRSTWENVANSQALLEPHARIVIVSEPVHAAKARALLAAQRTDLAARLVVDPGPAPRLASPWRVGLGLIDLLLSRRVVGWAQDSARGLAGLRRLAVLCR